MVRILPFPFVPTDSRQVEHVIFSTSSLLHGFFQPKSFLLIHRNLSLRKLIESKSRDV